MSSEWDNVTPVSADEWEGATPVAEDDWANAVPVSAPAPPAPRRPPNNLRAALEARRREIGISLGALGPEGIAAVGETMPLPETTMPWITVPMAAAYGGGKPDREAAITHPFDALGEIMSRGPRTVGQAAVEPVAEMGGQALSSATLGLMNPDQGEALVRGAAEVPADMVQAITGDPTMLALTAAGMAIPPAAAAAPFLHALPTAYFGAEGVTQFAHTDWGVLKPGVWSSLPGEEKVDFARSVLGGAMMVGLPLWHAGKGYYDAATAKPQVEPEMQTQLPVNREVVAETMASMLEEQPFLPPEARLRRVLPEDSMGGILARASSPTFLLDAMERATPLRAPTEAVGIGVPYDFKIDPLAADSPTRRKIYLNEGVRQAELERITLGPNWSSGRPAWMLPGKINPDLPMGTEEGAYAILKKEADKVGLAPEKLGASFILWKRAANVWENASNLDVSHFWGMLADQQQNPVGTRLYQRTATGELVATHNFGESALDFFDQLAGRVPGLSIGISRPSLERKGGELNKQFGGFTLVLRPEAVDPRRNPNLHVYDRDWWTPSSPRFSEDRVPNERGNLYRLADYGDTEYRTFEDADVAMTNRVIARDLRIPVEEWEAMSPAEKIAALPADAVARAKEYADQFPELLGLNAMDGDRSPSVLMEAYHRILSDERAETAMIDPGYAPIIEAPGVRRLAVDKTGTPITPETAAAAWDKRTTPSGPPRMRMARRLDSLEAIRERAKEGLTTRRGDSGSQKKSEDLVRKAGDEIDMLAASYLGEDMRGIGAGLVEDVLEIMAGLSDGKPFKDRLAQEIVQKKLENMRLGPKLLVDSHGAMIPRASSVFGTVIQRLAEELRALPTDYFEAKNYAPLDPRDVVALIADGSVSEAGLNRAKALAERLGWEFHSGTEIIRPDSKLTDFRERMIFSFSDRFFQQSGASAKGATTILPDGRAMIELFEKADESSLVHESAHVFRRTLYAMMESARDDAKPGLKAGLKHLEEWAKAKNGWDTAAEERWAQGVEKYLRDGKAPSPKLQPLFTQFKNWLRSIYDDLGASKLATFSPEVEKFFDTYVLAESRPSIEKEVAWAQLARMKREDREAYEAKLALRDLPAARQRVQDRLSAFSNWVQLARQERVLLGASDVERFSHLRAWLGLQRADDASMLSVQRAREIHSKIERALAPPAEGASAAPIVDSDPAVVANLLTDPVAMANWKDNIRARVRGGQFTRNYAQKIGNLVGFFEHEAETFRSAAGKIEAVGGILNEANASWNETTKTLMRKRAAVRLLIREMRKTLGEAKEDPAEERLAVLRMADKYYASPRLLQEAVDKTIAPRLEQIGNALAQAEAAYKARVEAIAMRGSLGDSFGSSAIEDAARAELVEQIRQDVGAARKAMGLVDGLDVAFEGTGIDPSSVIRDLSAEVREAMGVRGGLSDTNATAIEIEAARLMGHDAIDATTQAALSAWTPFWEKARKGFLPALMNLRELVRKTFSPMSRLDPYVYSPDRVTNRVLRRLGLEEKRPAELTDAQMEEARLAFENYDGHVMYYDRVISPDWLDAIGKAFTLPERQVMTFVRETAKLNMDRMEAKYRKLVKEAHTELSAAEGRGDTAGVAAARNKLRIASQRLNRAEAHVGIRGDQLSPRMAYVLTQVAGAFDAMQNLGARAGLWDPEAFWENYVPRVYRADSVEAVKNFFRDSAMLGGPNKHSFERTFDSIVEAYVFAGLRPATLDIATLVDGYGRSLTETIQKTQLVHQLRSIAPDLFQYVDRGRKPEQADFIDISRWVSRGVVPAEGLAPDARLYAHNVVGTLIKNMSETSAWDKTVAGRAAKDVNHFLKKIGLAIDLYHFWQLTRVAAGSGVYNLANVAQAAGLMRPGGLQSPLIEEYVKHGLDLSAGDWARRAMFAELEADVKSRVGKGAQLWHALGEVFEKQSRHMWERYAPALKLLAMNHQVERLLANPKTAGLSREAIVRASARVVNDKFGSMTWSTHGRSKTLNDTLTLAFLAPQWLETRFRNVLGATKGGAEGALWRDYWLGEGVMDTVRGAPGDASTAARRWATGYIVQGMMISAAGNALVSALWPDSEEKDKAAAERGANWFFSTTIPTFDKRGVPLKVSPFATYDYMAAFVGDLNSAMPLMRWYRGRMGPLFKAAIDTYTGLDYAGRAQRSEFVSLETVGILFDGLFPWTHNIFFGSVSEAATADDIKFGTARSIARTLGGHTASSYLPGVQDTARFLVDEAQQWNRDSAKEWQKWYYKADGLGDILFAIARKRAERHNARVDAFIEEVKRDHRKLATLGRFAEELNRAKMRVPERK